MTLEEEYLKFRKIQKRAREEMWHVFSHHQDIATEWKTQPFSSCFSELKRLVEWEPEEDE